MISHKNFMSFIAACQLVKDVNINENDVGLSYLPLPHILEREFLYAMFNYGATVVYYQGEILKLKDDLALVKPTIFVSVPRLYSRFYDVIKGKMEEANPYLKVALDHGLNVKLNNHDNNGGYTHKVYDPIFFNKTKQALGGRVRLMVSGSAPLLPEAQKFLKVVMCAPLLEGYGSTETTGAAFISMAADNNLRHVGGPVVIFI